MKKIAVTIMAGIGVFLWTLGPATADLPLRQTGTTVCGTLEENTLWKESDSPIVATCEVRVREGVTLTIHPGVQVRFGRGSSMGRFGLRVEGELVARGTEEHPILFTSDSTPAYQGDWSSLFFSKTSPPSRFDKEGEYIGGSILEFCIIEYGGSAGRLGAVEIDGAELYLNHVIVHKAAASAIQVRNGTVSLNNSKLINNSNSQGLGGGILAHASTLRLDGSTIQKNSVAGSGGAIYAHDSTVFLKTSDVVDNMADGKGGGIFATDSVVSIEGSRFEGNVSSYRGGALYASRSKVNIEETEFIRNKAQLTSVIIGEAYGQSRSIAFGGAVYLVDSEGTIERTVFLQNRAMDQCGALAISGSAIRVRNNVFAENSADVNGSALCSDGVGPQSSITENAFAGNHANDGKTAGVVYFSGGPLPEFSGNTLYESGKVVLSNQTETVLSAKRNWWGTQDETEIRRRILGLAEFLPILEHPGAMPEVKVR